VEDKERGGQEERVSSRDLLSYVLDIPTAYQTSAHTMRLSATMKRLGWERNENKITIGNQQVRGFFRHRPSSGFPAPAKAAGAR
jgi:hypothetical protein